MDHDTLYETDICAWAEQQAAALRGFASRVDLPNELDLLNIVEEIEDVGNSQLRAVSSFMRLILSHTILIALEADAESARHWSFEVLTFRGNLIQAWQRSMRQRSADGLHKSGPQAFSWKYFYDVSALFHGAHHFG